MTTTIPAGETKQIIDGEQREKVLTELRIRGADGVIGPDRTEVEDENGGLIEDGDDRTNFDPRGLDWFIKNTDASATMDVHILERGGYADTGGLD